MNHHCLLAFKQFVKFLTALGILLDDLHMHIIRYGEGRTNGCLAATHDDHVLHVGIVFLAYEFPDVWDILLGGHEISEVVDAQLVETTWDQGVAATLDGYDMIGIVRSAEVSQRLVQNLRRLTEFDTQEDEGTTMYIPPLTNPRQLQAVGDICSHQHLGIDKRVEAQVLKERLQLRRQVFVVVDTGHCLLRTKGMGQDTGIDVDALFGRHANEQIGMLCTSLLQGLDTRG